MNVEIQKQIKALFIQATDPSGERRVLKFNQWPVILGTNLQDKNQLRDPKLGAQAIEINILPNLGNGAVPEVQVRSADGQTDIILGDLKLQSAILPHGAPFKVGDTELKLSFHEFKEIVTDFPRGEKPWHTFSQTGTTLLRSVKRAAQTKLSLYLYGETGTGKEVLAKLAHVWSARASGPFVPINCGAFSLSLVESELFGHIKGSFTGATRDRPGALQQAHGGTLFLDEVGDLPPEIQVKLLRFLESGEIRPVGSDRTFHADVRIVCATHKPLAKMVKEGTFRQDLFFRLASIPLEIPNLRSRPEDIDSLARIFALEQNKIITKEAMLRLKAYSWPGNVRELRHALERACGSVGPEQAILNLREFDFLVDQMIPEDQPLTEQSVEMILPGVFNLKEMEKLLLLRALRMAKGNRSEAAKILGVARSTLFEMLKRYNVIGPKSTDYWLSNRFEKSASELFSARL